MRKNEMIRELKTFGILWSTQSLSQLGSEMTSFALTLWLYAKTGSALQTALLSICSYTPYVLMSIFAGALSDRWDKKKVMLVCDTLAAVCSLSILFLMKNNMLMPVHMYILNALNGLMNTVQQPAGDVAMTLITPKKYYQKTSGMRSFSQSLVTILHPVFATTLFASFGLETVIYVDLATFAVAFIALLFFVDIPDVHDAVKSSEKSEEAENVLNAEADSGSAKKESVLVAAGKGIKYLKENRMIFDLILFLAGVNLVASAFDAVLPAFILPRANGGNRVLGIVTSCAGIATLVGSLIVTVIPAPKDRIRTIVVTMLFSLSIENILISLSRSPLVWRIGQVLGWIFVPVMSANLDVILRTTIPVDMQGRVYSCRNTFQFFTIPVGFFLGGLFVDRVCEPFMSAQNGSSILNVMFGTGKGSGASMVMIMLGIAGTLICLIFGKILDRYRYEEADGMRRK